jgi:Pyruvate/2-oxoacid:ferredoxin oxidoreductase gamma subunit
VRKAVEDSIPKGTEELNLKAFERGYKHGMKLKKEREARAIQ